MTGVQRYSTEITAAIDRLAVAGDWPRTVVLTPPRTTACVEHSPRLYQNLELREVGRTAGHLWEQTELPSSARSGILVNLGNTAPVLGGKRQVVVIHDAGVFDTPESYSLRFRLWYKTLQFGLAKTGAQIATVSEFARDRIVARLGLDPTRVTITYEGADHILRVPSDESVLARHGLLPQQFAIVVSSRAAHKNLEALSEAAAMMARRGLTIAVTGAGNPEIFRDVKAAGFTERHLGRVSDTELRALYENAACLLFPSRYEGFGLPPVEAMACGCPVVASGSGSVEEICGDAALYFASDDRTTVVNAIEQLLDEEGLADKLRMRGRERAAALSWDASARALGEAIRRMT
jgi:glycosyltransferase involved in cell wall biosynthesis